MGILTCSYIIDSILSTSILLSFFMEFFLKTLNNSTSFFSLIVDVAETSGCTYMLTYFLIDQTNFVSLLHDNLTFFSTKINVTILSNQHFLIKYIYLNYNKWLWSAS